MNGAEIIESVDNAAIFIGVVAFVINIVVPIIFAVYSDDERLNQDVLRILEAFSQKTLRPLAVAFAIALVLVRIIFKE